MTAPQQQCFILFEYNTEIHGYKPIRCYTKFNKLMDFFRTFNEVAPVIVFYKDRRGKTIYLKNEQRFHWTVKMHLNTLTYCCGRRQYMIKEVAFIN